MSLDTFFLICSLATLIGVTYVHCTSLLDDYPGRRIMLSFAGVILYGLFGYLALPVVTV